MKKKSLLVLGLAGVAALSLASCGGNSTNGSQSAAGSSAAASSSEEQIVLTATAYTKANKKSSGSVSPSSSVALNAFTNKEVDVFLNYKGNSGITYRSEAATPAKPKTNKLFFFIFVSFLLFLSFKTIP